MTTIKPIKLAYKVIEPPAKSDKNDIILLHGTTCSKEHFDGIANDLAVKTSRRIYALDARNHGDSEWSDVFNYDAMAADVINFMDEHKIKSAVLVGHSMGGRLAMTMAFKHPDRVEKIVVEDISPKAFPRTIMENLSSFLKVLEDSINEIPPGSDYKKAVASIFEYIIKNPSEGVLKNVKLIKDKELPFSLAQKDGKYVWKTNFKVLLNQRVNMGYSQDMEGVFNKPALFIYGTLSQFNVGNDEEYILKLFPRAQLNGLVASHFVHYECSEKFVQISAKFIE